MSVPTSRAVVPATAACLLAALALAGATGCEKQKPVRGLQHAQTEVKARPVQYHDRMAPVSTADGREGLIEATMVRTPEELGDFAHSLPDGMSFETHMFVFLGKEMRWKQARDSAQGLLLIDAEARDPFSPGWTVTRGAMKSMVTLVFDGPSCDQSGTPPAQPATVEPSKAGGGVTAAAAEGEKKGDDTESADKPSADPWKNQLIVFAVPRIDGPVDVSIQQLECEIDERDADPIPLEARPKPKPKDDDATKTDPKLLDGGSVINGGEVIDHVEDTIEKGVEGKLEEEAGKKADEEIEDKVDDAKDLLDKKIDEGTDDVLRGGGDEEDEE